MNYREQQLRQIIKRDYVPLKDYRDLEEQFRLTQLDVDYQIQVNTKQENERLKQELKDWIDRYQELENNLNQQAQQANWDRDQAQEEKQLYLNKITDLEQALINLAKQKLKSKKEASQLLTQLETNWKNDKENWSQEKTHFEAQHHTLKTQLTHEIQTQQAKIKELEAWSEGQHNRILELETKEQTLTNDLNQAQQDLNLAQQEKQNLTQQIQQARQREQNLTQIHTQQNQRITFLESELAQANQKLTQTQEKAQQEKQTKQEKINQLQQNNLTLQAQITNLTHELTQKTQTIANQLTQINTQTAQLTRQREVLQQLLANREQRLVNLEGDSQ